MAEFKEELVINALHTDKAEVGKIYWFADNIFRLKYYVEKDVKTNSGVLKAIEEDVFKINTGYYYLLYPYEEPPKKRMTHLQLMEWLSKGNGVYKTQNDYVHTSIVEQIEWLDAEVTDTILIRPFGQTEWIEPTVDIYERDCKGGKE